MKYFVTRGEDRVLDTARRGLRGSFVHLSDGISHYELAGPEGGYLVVLTGGLTVPLFYWDDLAAQLHHRGLRTLAYSAYGRGYSDRIVGRYDEGLFVRQLRELIDTLIGGQRFHLVGSSMGALVAMAYLHQHAAATTPATLTLIGPAGLGQRPAGQKLLGHDTAAALIGKYFGQRMLGQHLSHNVRDHNRATDLQAMIRRAYRYQGSLYALFATLRDFPLFDRGELYRRTGNLRVPTLLLWGDEDDVTPISGLGQAVALLRPDATHVIPQCGHMAPFERPNQVSDELAPFIASYPDRSPS